MSEDQTTQAAVDTTKTPAVPGVAGESARNDGDDLDTLLAEYDESRPKASPEPARPEPTGEADTTRKPETDPAISQVQRYIFRQDMDKTIKNIRGNLDAEFFDDAFVESWIDTQAKGDHRLGLAWANRHNNPKQFAKVEEMLGRTFAKKYGKLPDKQATEDREAVSHAVRGASTRAPEGTAPDMTRLTDQEFQAEKDRLFDKK
jgi:hypothetical protein